MASSDHSSDRCADGSVRVTGILHATTVHDGGLAVQLHPDNGGPPINIAYRDAQTVLPALCEIVSVCGTIHPERDGRQRLDLLHLGVCRGSRPSFSSITRRI